MKAALYARYSSENQKELSITDQFRNCEDKENGDILNFRN